MASMQLVNKNRDLWNVKDKSGRVVASGLSVDAADRILSETQSRENQPDE